MLDSVIPGKEPEIPITSSSLLFQILGALDQDDQAGKQKLAYKLEQVITLMSIDS